MPTAYRKSLAFGPFDGGDFGPHLRDGPGDDLIRTSSVAYEVKLDPSLCGLGFESGTEASVVGVVFDRQRLHSRRSECVSQRCGALPWAR
jgi:hypothetical protein